MLIFHIYNNIILILLEALLITRLIYFMYDDLKIEVKNYVNEQLLKNKSYTTVYISRTNLE